MSKSIDGNVLAAASSDDCLSYSTADGCPDIVIDDYEPAGSPATLPVMTLGSSAAIGKNV